MRLRFTILLILLNLTLFSVLIFVEKDRSSEKRFADSDRLLLSSSAIDSLMEINIHGRAIEGTWTLSRQEDSWTIDSPYAWRANAFAIERILNQLRTLTWETRFFPDDLSSSGRTLADYGLEDPAITLSLKSEDDRIFELHLGSATEVGQRIYARTQDSDTIFVIERNLLDGLVLDPKSLLDREVLNLPTAQIRALQVQEFRSRNIRLRLVRNGDSWQFVSPIETPASEVEVRQFLARLDTLEVDAFLPPESLALEFDNPALRISFESYQSRESLSILPIGETGEAGVYIRNDAFPTILRIDTPLLAELRNLQESLREKHLLPRRESPWTALEIRVDNRSTTLQKLENAEWQVVSTERDGTLQTFSAEKSRIEELKGILTNLSAEQFVTDAPSEEDLRRFGLLQPQRIISIRFDEGAPWELKIGNIAPDSARFYAQTSQSSSVSTIRPFILSQFPLSPLSYRNLSIRVLPEATRILEVQLIDLESGDDLLLKDEETEKALRPDLESFFRKTTVARYLKTEYESPLELDRDREIPWRWEIRVRYILPGADPENPAIAEWKMSERLGGTTQFVGFPSIGMIAFLPQSLIERLEPFLAKVDEPSPPPIEVETKVIEPKPTPAP